MVYNCNVLKEIRGADCNSVFYILSVKDEALIQKAMLDCDYAFTISVIHRENYRELFQKIIQNAVVHVIVDEPGENIVGYAAFYANDRETHKGYITLICVKPEFQRNGLGSELIETCFQICKQNNMDSVGLEVLKCDTKAIAFYKSKGFQVTRESDHDSYYMNVNI